MGCNSGKPSAPTAPKTRTPEWYSADPLNHTLLTTNAQGQNLEKEAAKETPAVSAERADPSQSVFNGAWNNGVINGDVLTWNDGVVSQVRIDEMTKVIEVTYQGTSFAGELRDDDKIHWDDGDTWTRVHFPNASLDTTAGGTEHADLTSHSQVETVPKHHAKQPLMRNESGHTDDEMPTPEQVVKQNQREAAEREAAAAARAAEIAWQNQKDAAERKAAAAAARAAAPSGPPCIVCDAKIEDRRPKQSGINYLAESPLTAEKPTLAPRKERTMCCC